MALAGPAGPGRRRDRRVRHRRAGRRRAARRAQLLRRRPRGSRLRRALDPEPVAAVPRQRRGHPRHRRAPGHQGVQRALRQPRRRRHAGSAGRPRGREPRVCGQGRRPPRRHRARRAGQWPEAVPAAHRRRRGGRRGPRPGHRDGQRRLPLRPLPPGQQRRRRRRGHRQPRRPCGPRPDRRRPRSWRAGFGRPAARPCGWPSSRSPGMPATSASSTSPRPRPSRASPGSRSRVAEP